MSFLDLFFAPKAIAVMGASERSGSMGGIVLQNLKQGGYNKPLFAVNLKNYTSVYGVPCVSSLSKLDQPIELVVMCLPAEGLLKSIRQSAKVGCKAILILTGGMSRDYIVSSELNQKIKELARELNVRIIGPNSLGLMVPSLKLNASYAHLAALPGEVAYIGQSSAIGASLLDWATGRGIGFSHFLTVGARADVSISDIVDHLASDRRVKAILLHVETVRNASRFMSVLRAASKTKKVLLIRTPSDREAPLGLPDWLRVEKAFYERAGVVLVENLSSLFSGMETLTRRKSLLSHKLAILSNGLGSATMAKSMLLEQGGETADLSALKAMYTSVDLHAPKTREDTFVFPAAIEPDFLCELMLATEKQKDLGAILVMISPNARFSFYSAAEAVVRASKSMQRTIIVCLMGEATARQARILLDHHGILSFQSPFEAVNAFMMIIHHEKAQESLLETPMRSLVSDDDSSRKARQAIHRAREAGQFHLHWLEVVKVLKLYGYQFNKQRYASDVSELFTHAWKDFPAVLRLLHEDYSYPFVQTNPQNHAFRTVRISLNDRQEVEQAAVYLLQQKDLHCPDSAHQGFVLQPLVRKVDSLQFNLAITRDPIYGPLILFGEGGARTNILADRQVALPPLNSAMAKNLLHTSQAWKALSDQELDVEHAESALADALLALSNMAIDLPELSGLEMNMLWDSHKGLLVLGAAMSIGKPVHAVISTYPRYLEKSWIHGERQWCIRPIKAEDEPLLANFYHGLPPEVLKLRFFGSRLHFEHRELAALCQIDYRREMAFIAVYDGHIVGEVRTWTHISAGRLEYAIVLDPSMNGTGLAHAMMQQVITFAKGRGIKVLYAETLLENQAMRKFAAKLGFSERLDHEEAFLELVIDDV